MKNLIGSVAVGVGTGVPTARAARGPSLVPWPAKVREFFPQVLGTAVGCGLVIGSRVSGLRGAKALAAGVLRVLRLHNGRYISTDTTRPRIAVLSA